MSNLCSVCAGTGKPISGKPCICDGRGTQLAELEGFKILAFEQQNQIDKLERVVEEIKALHADKTNDEIDRDIGVSEILAELNKDKQG